MGENMGIDLGPPKMRDLATPLRECKAGSSLINLNRELMGKTVCFEVDGRPERKMRIIVGIDVLPEIIVLLFSIDGRISIKVNREDQSMVYFFDAHFFSSKILNAVIFD